MKSIFDKIEKIIRENGELPENFVAEEKDYTENELSFAPGAMEGIIGHHTSAATDKVEFIEELKKYLEMPEADAIEAFEKDKASHISMASIRNRLLNEIIENKKDFEPRKVASLAYYFTKCGSKAETVKLGLSLLALFDFSDNEEICYVLKNLGYCEEFTKYVIMNTEQWEEKKRQDFYFELAKKLNGWGKIEVVEMLKIDTEEKKEWLLCHGCRNSILYSYLAYFCAKECDLYNRLKKGNLTDEEMQGACDIMEGLTGIGPYGGISGQDEPIELTLFYLEELEKHTMGIEYVEHLCRLDNYFKDEKLEDAEIVCEKIQKILHSLDIGKLVTENLLEKPYECLKVVKWGDLDVSEQLIHCMKLDFCKYYSYCYHLFEKNKFVDEFFAICDEKIDAGFYPKGMGDSLGFGKLGDGILSISSIVKYIGNYPLQGKKLIEISIQSPFTRWRSIAADAMLEWTEKLNKPLIEIDEHLYNMVKQVSKVECSDTIKERWEELLK